MTNQEFKELTGNMSDEEFRNLNPFIKRNCADCIHLKGAVSLWCTNDEAKKKRGTSIPAISNCPFWQPNFDFIDDEYKTVENGYKKPIIKNKSVPKRGSSNLTFLLILVFTIFFISCVVLFIFNNL